MSKELQLMDTIFELFSHSTGITTDSRHPRIGSLFFALKGDNFDANSFAQAALEGGCSHVIIDNPHYYIDHRTICVPDTLTCLQDLALRYRRTFAIPFLAITGTNGKTTTKELIAAVLGQKYRIHATVGNFNNHIGVPLTLLSMPQDTEIAVVEMGANHLGEIKQLCEIAEPTHGLITGIGKAHLEGFGSIEGIVKTKGELYDWIKAHDGTAFCNTADSRLVEMARARFENLSACICYGPLEQNTDILAPNSAHPHLSFTLGIGTEVHTQLAGDYNVTNVLAAMAVGAHFNLTEAECITGVESYSPGNHRSQLISTERNILLVDAYNANPTSMQAALTSFAGWKEPHKAVILGDMFELGEESLTEHQQIIQLVTSLQIELAILIGKEFNQALLRKASSTLPSLLHFELREQAIDYLKLHTIKGMTILVKGSRGMKLETLIEYL